MMFMKCVVYAYFLIMILMTVSSLIKYVKNKIIDKCNQKKKIKYRQIIETEIKRLTNTKWASNEHIIFLENNLRKTENLLIFELLLTDLNKEKNNKIEEYCNSISRAFQNLAIYYKEKDSTQKAYFTHVLSLFPALMQNDDNSIQYAMMHYVFDPSIYCRENAMLFFYHKGIEKHVVNSLKKISHRNLYYNTKLLTDDLLLFSGNHQNLSTLLLSEFDEFNVNFQIGIINYLRLKDNNKKEILYQKLISRKYHKEVELAIIRYFAKHTYKDILEYLLEIMKDKNNYNDEYRLVTAFTLASYDQKETRYILIESLMDKNWYVRKNSALSLARMKLTKAEMKKIELLEDPYAKDMIKYIFHDQNKSLEVKE